MVQARGPGGGAVAGDRESLGSTDGLGGSTGHGQREAMLIAKAVKLRVLTCTVFKRSR